MAASFGRALSLDDCGDDAVFAVYQDDTRHGAKWHAIAAVVDSGAADHIKPTPTDKSRAGIGFRGGGG